jgi:futalosine hydrolase
MQILIVSATAFEVEILRQHLVAQMIPYGKLSFQKGANSLEFLISGVGVPATIFHLSQHLSKKRYDLVVNAGIAGAFNMEVELGSVFQVIEDRFADLGIEERDGTFRDLFDIELAEPDIPPYQGGRFVQSQGSGFNFLPQAKGITVNKVHGTAATIQAIREKYQPDLESMEGAGVFYCCHSLGIPCLQIRAVSNHVEPRRRDRWNIPLAIENLNQTLIEMVEAIF